MSDVSVHLPDRIVSVSDLADKYVLQDWIVEALRRRGGSATLLEVAGDIWASHEQELRASGNLFLTWQYDMRWAATALRHAGRLRAAGDSARGVWELP